MATNTSATAASTTELRLLSGIERDLLEELFSAMPDAETGVDAVRFRTRHRDHLKVVDRLRDENLLRENQERLFVYLPAIALLATVSTRRWLEQAARVFKGLEESYVEDPRKPVPVCDLATKLSMDETATRQILSYFSQMTPWLAFPPRDVLSNAEATVGASDVVIKHKDFWSALSQLEEWRVQSPFQLTHMAWQAALGGEEGATAGSEGIAPNPLPSWVETLSEPIRLVMAEVYRAVGAGMRVLPAIGVRTALDMYFSDVLGSDSLNFEQKVTELAARKVLTATEADQVRIVIDSGNASAHRGYAPTAQHLQTILGVGERLLRAHYDFPASTKRLQAEVPARPPKPAKKHKSS